MTKKQITYLSVGIIIVLALVAYGVFFTGIGEKKPSVITEEESKTAAEERLEAQKYTPEVSKDVKPTTPKFESSIAPNVKGKIGAFDLKITKDGFNPQEIIVNNGDFVQLVVVAEDGDYDVSVPYLGLYQSLKKGEIKQIGFSATAPGSFMIECRDFCPSAGKIQGQLIVLP